MLPEFTSADTLQQKIDAYFAFIDGEYHFEELPVKNSKTEGEIIKQKVWDRESLPATLSGLVFFLGFFCRKDFDKYETSGPFADTLKRGRLRVEVEYEKKLHFQSPTGAIFALKSMGWDERETTISDKVITTLQIEILNTPYKPAQSEPEVDIDN
jgi:hypothetical protein